MLTGVFYSSDGSLRDDTGHAWLRVRDWLEPNEAAAQVRAGVPFVVEWCDSSPVRGRPERFRRDVLARMITRNQAERYYDGASAVPTVVVGEVWSGASGDCLVFVEQGPHPR